MLKVVTRLERDEAVKESQSKANDKLNNETGYIGWKNTIGREYDKHQLTKPKHGNTREDPASSDLIR